MILSMSRTTTANRTTTARCVSMDKRRQMLFFAIYVNFEHAMLLSDSFERDLESGSMFSVRSTTCPDGGWKSELSSSF